MIVRRIVIFASVLAALAIPTLAQQGTTGLRGHVLDPQGNAIPGVTVMAKNEETGMYRQTVSDKDGVYTISGITPGTYEMTAELTGFNTFRPPAHAAGDRKDRDGRRQDADERRR